MTQPDSSAFDFVEEIASLDCAESVLASFDDKIRDKGFSAVALGELPTPGARALKPFFVSTWSPVLAEAYVGEGHVKSDPSIETARTSALPVLWTDLEKRWRADGRSVSAFEFTTSYGFNEGLVIPVHRPGGYHGLVTLLGEARVPARDRIALHLMALYLHERLRELMAPELSDLRPLPRLSAGETECLKWLLAGKSDWDMSEILRISEATVHWRVEQAKRKFGVKTRAQLVALAIQHGYIRA